MFIKHHLYTNCLLGTVAAAAAKSLQSCLTLCGPIDGSPLVSVPGVLQARVLESVAISFSNAWKWKVKVKSLSRAWLLVTPWTSAYQAPPSMGFSRQKYWSGLPLPSPNHMLDVIYFLKFPNCFPNWIYHFSFPPRVFKSSIGSKRCVVAAHWGFNLDFLSD